MSKRNNKANWLIHSSETTRFKKKGVSLFVHWFREDGRPIHIKKYSYVLKN